MSMQTEPIRLPAWVASVLALVVLPALASLLTGADWRTVALGVIAALIPLLGLTETVRAFTDSPATRRAKAAYVRHKSGVAVDVDVAVQAARNVAEIRAGILQQERARRRARRQTRSISNL